MKRKEIHRAGRELYHLVLAGMQSAVSIAKGNFYLLGDVITNNVLRATLPNSPIIERWGILSRDAKQFEQEQFTDRIAEKMRTRYRGINDLLYSQ